MTPKYLLEKIARHGSAAQRLIDERACNMGEFAGQSEISAIAFDAADFVWAYLFIMGYGEAQESRQVRNAVAQAITEVLKSVDQMHKESDDR